MRFPPTGNHQPPAGARIAQGTPRRGLLRAAARIGGAGLAVMLGGLRRRRPAHAADERTLAAYLDTLMPADPDGPGAVALDVPKRLMALAAADADYAALLDRFRRWLDARAQASGGAFAELPVEAREAILRAAEAAGVGSLPRRAFERTRHDAFTLFYGDARAWAAIGYGGPPQPEGFPDFDQPPRAR